jgi:hypothetical protein
MDAKVLKAAVSAALRVTVSTTLIGCGGNVTSNAGAPASAEGGTSGQTASTTSATTASGDQVGTGYPKSEPVSGGKAGVGAATAGAPTGGSAPLAGMASTAEAGSAGEPNGGAAQASCAQVDACFALLEAAAPGLKFGESVADANKPCCQAVLDSLVNGESSYVCLSELNERFMRSPARAVCCSQENWSYPACAPWGPPVPPELSLATLLKWEAAA